MAKKNEVLAVVVQVESLTDGGTIYAAGQTVLNPSDALIAVAKSNRVNDDGVKLARMASKQEALRAAKQFDNGQATTPVVFNPPQEGEEPIMVVGGDTAPMPAEEEVTGDAEESETEGTISLGDVPDVNLDDE